MRAIVLAGGLGTRLRPLTLDTPKQLLPVAGASMLQRVLAPFEAHGVTEVVLSLGYRPDGFRRAFPGDRVGATRVRYAVEPEPLGTAGAIRFAAEQAGLGDETVVVHNGDVITQVDLEALLARHRDRHAAATIALAPVEDPSAFGVVVANDRGLVERFVEKPPRGTAAGNLINAGTYLLEPSVIRAIPPGRAVSIEREIFPELALGGGLYALAGAGYWLDLGTADTFLKANLDVLRRNDSEGPLLGARVVGHGAWALGNVVLESVPGPAVLVEAGAWLGPDAEVSESVLGPSSRVGRGAVVRRSVLFEGAVVDAGAEVSDSVVGRAALVGRGARVGGFSLLGTAAVVEPGDVLDGGRIPTA